MKMKPSVQLPGLPVLMLSRVLVGARSSRAVEKRWIFGAVAAAFAGTSVFFGAVLSLRKS